MACSCDLDEIDIVRDAFIEYLNERGYKCRKVYDNFVQMEGAVSPVNIWMDNLNISAYDNDKFSICDPEAFDKIIEAIKRHYKWDQKREIWAP